MRSIFTKIFIFTLLSGFGLISHAQTINTLTVNSPAGIAGNYAIVRAAFGSQSDTPITANAGFINDGTANPTLGCNPATNSLTGLVAFVDRGACTVAANGEFGAKALKAQNAGAVAVIICNNAANATQSPFVMAAGSQGANVTVPTFMVSYNDCLKIRTDILAGGVNVTLRFYCENTSNYDDKVIWGKNPGEGDFEGGLNGWTIDKENTWEWNKDGAIRRGAYGGTQMNSHTDCNGVMEFNSDFLDNGGVQGNFGQGACPSPCRGALISPIINLTPFEIKGIIIEFHQALRQFRSQFYLMASRDGGITWPDTVQFNTEFPVNSAAFSDLRKRIALNNYENATSLRFKFEYVGDYYYWGIDDVVVINDKFVDLQVNDNFYSVSPQLRTPKTQVSEIPMLADIQNTGNAAATNTVLGVVYTDEDDNELAVFVNPYGTVPAGALIENRPFPETYTPPATEGFYYGNYVVVSEDEEPGENNVREFFFEVTDKTYGNLLPEAEVTPANYMTDIAAIWAVSDRITNFYSGGNIFYVKNGKDYTVENVRFGLQNPAEEVDGTGFVVVDLFEWQDLNRDGACQPDERELIGTNSAFIDSSFPNLRNIEIPMWRVDQNGEGIEGTRVQLKDNTTYFVVAHTSPVFDGVPRYRFLTYNGFANTSFNRSLYHAATNFAFDTLKIDRRAGSLWQLSGTSGDFSEMRGRNFTIIGNSATLFSYAVMYLEMDVVRTTSVKNDFTNNIKASTFPNPASRDLFVDLTLEKLSRNVKIDLISMDGQMIMSRNFENVQDERLKLDVSNVPGGSYTVLINTDEGAVSRKVLVIK